MTNFVSRAAAAALFVSMATAASAADLGRPVKAPEPYPQTIAAYGFSWTGAYVGANIGANLAHGVAGDSSGVIGGLQAGYLWQTGQFVYGLEADVSLGNNSKSTSFSDAVLGGVSTQRDRIDWNTSYRGRLGYAFDRFLVYGTGGLALANIESRFSNTNNGVTVTDKNTNFRAGWSLGAGLEYAITNNVTVRGEYLHNGFGHYNVNYGGNGVSVRQNIDENLLRVGVNYKF
ncbi:MAG: porin family protein [Ancalomicrobiaceae bacterium]|nr:porin family protein [Ancalomicrobiaceae bacterium]